ncbi:MAG: AAA family ATPase [Clostridia bacterium]|nr:AAA family ATPase [Clostridia bacterium]
MPKFNLVLADSDPWYIEGLSKFTRGVYASKFNVNVFTQKSSLTDYLKSNNESVDILLISPEMLLDDMAGFKVGTTILLSDGRLSDSVSGYPWVKKYQPGEKILNEVIALYSGTNLNVESLVKGDRKTTVVSVFSPQGGSGKSLLSVNLSLHLASRGLKTLYLNLETLSSIPFFIHLSNNELGLSNILFDLKEKGKNVKLKIDLAKSFDSLFNISYFKPLDCSLELDEVTDGDINKLLFELKEIGQFDVVVVDTDTMLNRRNIGILGSSDEVLLVVLQDLLAKVKLDTFFSEVRKISPDLETELNSKLTMILNKYNPDSFIDDIGISGKTIMYQIPFLNDLFLLNNGLYVLNQSSMIQSYMKNIAEHIMQKFK